MSLSFLKMHGAGNDFAIFDGRREPLRFTAAQLQAIAARHTGIGCDQVIVMERSGKADVFMRIYNADGGEVSSCGNATRCVGWIVMNESARDRCSVETKAGLLACERVDAKHIRADMGQPRFGWQDIPLAQECDTLHLDIQIEGLSDPAALSMGNPHMVFIVADVTHLRIRGIGPQLEHHPLFPERANVSFAQPLTDTHVKLRVWERGSGETLACGTAACATLVALNRRGLVADSASIEMPGGTLDVRWDKVANHVWMSGPVELSFTGTIPAEWRGPVAS